MAAVVVPTSQARTQQRTVVESADVPAPKVGERVAEVATVTPPEYDQQRPVEALANVPATQAGVERVPQAQVEVPNPIPPERIQQRTADEQPTRGQAVGAQST